ncbi:MAG: formylglycine-generating enzyme family protein [Gammaproteobacteria bacterium]
MIWSSAIGGKASIVTGSLLTLTCVGKRLLVKSLILALCSVGQAVVPSEAADPELEALERQLKVLEAEEAASQRAAEERERQAREAATRRAREAEKVQRREAEAQARTLALAGEFVPIPGRSWKMGKYEVTFAQWDACVADGGCNGYRPDDEGWGRENQPVINISYEDIESYVRWLNGKTGGRYRLPAEDEWEYAARGGTQTDYWWGNAASHEYANYGRDECCAGFAQGRDRWVNTAPVGQFPANPYGLHDVLGNVWEWTSSCNKGDCGRRVIRGGSWNFTTAALRVSGRSNFTSGLRFSDLGFRLVQD